MARFDLTDAEWTIIAPLLPSPGKENGRPRQDDSKVINGIFFVLRTGAPLRVICRSAMGPTRPCTTGSIVGRRRASGFEYSRRWRRDSPQSLQLIDSSIIRAHQHAAWVKRGPGFTPSAVLVED